MHTRTFLHSTPRFGTWLQQRPDGRADADGDVFANHICPDRIRRLTVYESYLDMARGMLAVVGDLGKKDRSMLGAYN